MAYSQFVHLLIIMCGAHVVADMPLQGERLSAAKRGLDDRLPRCAALAYHAVVHAALVAVITGMRNDLAIAEFVVHFATDALCTRNRIGGKTDQGIHITCKIIWAALAAYGVPLMGVIDYFAARLALDRAFLAAHTEWVIPVGCAIAFFVTFGSAMIRAKR